MHAIGGESFTRAMSFCKSHSSHALEKKNVQALGSANGLHS